MRNRAAAPLVKKSQAKAEKMAATSARRFARKAAKKAAKVAARQARLTAYRARVGSPDAPPGTVQLPVASARETWRELGRACRRRIPLAVLTLLVTLLGSVAWLVAPWVLGLLVDQLRAGASVADVLQAGVLIAAAAVLGGAITAVGGVLIAHLGEHILADLREQVVDRAVRLPPVLLEKIGTGDLVTRVGDDVGMVSRALTGLVPTVVSSAVTVVLTGVSLELLDWRLALAGMVALPVYVLALRWYLPRSGASYAMERTAISLRNQSLLGSLSGAATVRAHRTEDSHVAAVQSRSATALAHSVSVFRLFSGWAGWLNRAELIGLSAVLIVGFVLVREDIVSVGAATAAALYFHRLFNPLAVLLLTFDDVQSAGAGLARLVGVASIAAPGPALATSIPAGSSVRIEGLTHSYGEAPVVLDRISLVVPGGQRVALVGASGAGKSTLAAILAGVTQASGGHVWIGGVLLSEIDPEAVNAYVALVSQEVHVFAGTVLDNLRLADPLASEATVWDALEVVSAQSWVAALPDGLHTLIGESGRSIPPAAAQQLALARVVIADPPVIVLDEATAEAGSAGAHELEAAASAVAVGRTAITVAHRLTQAQAADRVLVMDQGVIIQDGTHAELVLQEGKYRLLWLAWSRQHAGR